MDRVRKKRLELVRVKEAQRSKILHGGVRYYKPMPQQETFHKDTNRIRLLSGGNRSSKTYSGCVEDVWVALGEHPYRPNLKGPNLVWVGTDSHENTRDIFRPIFDRLIPKDAIHKIVNGPRDTLKRYEFKNGSEISFKSYEAGREAFQGPAIPWIHLDEEPPEDIYSECLVRGMTCRGEIILTMTAVKGITWVHDRLYTPALKDKDGSSGIGYHRFSTMDNIYIPEEEKQRMLRSMTEMERRIRLFGEFVHRQGMVFDEFSLGAHVIPHDMVPQGSRFYEALDPGLHTFAGIFAHTDKYGTVIVHDEIYEHQKPLAEIKQRVWTKRDLYRSKSEDTVIDPAAAAKHAGMSGSVRDQLADSPDSVYCLLGNNDRQAGIFRMKEYLAYERDEKDKQLTIPRLLIMDNCVNLIHEFQNYHYSPTKSAALRQADQIHKADDHALDALRYLLMRRPSPAELERAQEPKGWTLEWYEKESARLTRHHASQETTGMKRWKPNS